MHFPPLLLASMQYEQVLKPLMSAYIDSTNVSGSRCTRAVRRAERNDQMASEA